MDTAQTRRGRLALLISRARNQFIQPPAHRHHPAYAAGLPALPARFNTPNTAVPTMAAGQRYKQDHHEARRPLPVVG
jgi:hypothetical protein